MLFKLIISKEHMPPKKAYKDNDPEYIPCDRKYKPIIKKEEKIVVSRPTWILPKI